MLGRRSFGHNLFSPFCPCSERAGDLYNYSYDPMNYYSGLDYEERCSLALVPLHEALGDPEPPDWAIKRGAHRCAHTAHTRPTRELDPRADTRPALAQGWTKAEVLAHRARVDRMTEAEREAHDEKWSHANKGQHYGWYPAMPYH
eukprot:4939280-Prymnesium_polylepis.1